MTFADTLLAALGSVGSFKEALGAALNRCEVGACTKTKNLSVGVTCAECGRFCCNAHGFVPLSAIPAIVQTRSLKGGVVCLDCLVVEEEP